MAVKALILGGTRYHGLILARSLALNGVEVSILNRGRYRSSYDFPVTHLLADRNSKDEITKVIGNKTFDVIIDNNAYNPEHVAAITEIIKNRCAQYIFTSSTAIYLKHNCEVPVSESSTGNDPDPLFDPKVVAYARNKLNTEEALKNIRGDRVTVLRFPNIFGEGDFLGKLRFFYERIKDGKGIILESEISKFSLIYIDDVINTFEKVILNEKCFGGTFNVSGEVNFSYEDFFEAIFGESFLEKNIIKVPTEVLRQNNYALPFAWSIPVSLDKIRTAIKVPYTPISKWGVKALSWELGNLPPPTPEFYNVRSKEIEFLRSFAQ